MIIARKNCRNDEISVDLHDACRFIITMKEEVIIRKD